MTPLLNASEVGIARRLEPCAIRLEAGTMTALVGPNGGGKTSLLHALARVGHPSGVVWIDGQDVEAAPPPQRRRLLSFLPATREMVWPVSARDVIALGLDRPDPMRVDELIELLELQSIAARPSDRLSTGERARVLLARALAPRPKVLLLDEPLSNLDPYWVLRIGEILRGIARGGAAILVSLHDLAALDLFDRAILVADGRLMGDDTPAKLFQEPSFAAAFRIRRDAGRWEISSPAGRRSSR